MCTSFSNIQSYDLLCTSFSNVQLSYDLLHTGFSNIQGYNLLFSNTQWYDLLCTSFFQHTKLSTPVHQFFQHTKLWSPVFPTYKAMISCFSNIQSYDHQCTRQLGGKKKKKWTKQMDMQDIVHTLVYTHMYISLRIKPSMLPVRDQSHLQVYNVRLLV